MSSNKQRGLMLEYEDEVVVEEQKKETFSITFFDTSLNEINLDNFYF